MKKTGRIVAILLTIMMIFVSVPAVDAYAEIDNPYTFGTDLYWGFEGDGILSITGTGSMQSEIPWSEYKDDIVSVHIGDGVTDISSGAFSNCPNLVSAELGVDITTIGSEAFKNCPKLKSIWLPEGVRYISKETFSGCTSLEKVTISGVDTLQGIEDSAFYKCESLTKFRVPSTVRSIGMYAFYGCSSLKEINIPEAVSSIDIQAFRGCSSLSDLTVEGANSYYDMKDGMLINTVENGEGAAEKNLVFTVSGLTGEIAIPENVTNIVSFAFENCQDVTKISIPASVGTINEYAFNKTYQTELVVDPGNSNFASSGGAVFDKDMTTMLYGAGGKDGMITVPEGVTAIADYACINTGLTSITLPESLTKIGQDAFKKCTGLTSITIPANVTNESGQITLGYGAFSGCTGLTEIKFAGTRPPKFGSLVFEGVTANAYFDHITGNTGWDDVLDYPERYQFGGTITWIENKEEQKITAAYERATPFEVVMERDFKDYGSGLQYVGERFDYPDAGDKVTFTFPDGTVKTYEYQKTGSSSGKFVNTADSTDVITNGNIHINLLDQAYDWEPDGDKNYYEVSFLNYPEDGNIVTCQVPVEVSSTPVASVKYEPVPVLLWAEDAGRSGMPAGSKVTVTYKDGTSEVFVDDFDTHSWISQKTGESVPYNENSYYMIRTEQNREDLSCQASYMGVTSEKNYGALYVAQSISLQQDEPMELIKGKNSTVMTDADGNEYDSYSLDKNYLFGEKDVLTVTYKNGLDETIYVDYVGHNDTNFMIPEDSIYHSGYRGDDEISGNYITIHMPDQSVDHFEVGKTYSMDLTYKVVGSNFELPAFTTEGEPYKVLIREAGPEEVTSVRFANSNVERIKKDETLQLAVTWEPSYAVVPNDAITWTSSNTAVATVDGNGLVTAVSEGSTQITADINGNKAYKNVEVYEEKVLTDETVSLSQTVFPYTGSIVSVDGYVMYNGKLIPKTYCSFNYTAIGAEGKPPINIGDYKVEITGSYGNYSGTATENFTIKGDLNRSATNVVVKLDKDEYVYEGTFVEPKVTVTAVGKGGGTVTLTEGTDYRVSYMKNNAPGTGNVIISAVADSYYMGEKFVPFTIKEAVVKNGWVKENGDWYYYDNGVMVTNKWMKDSKGWCWLQEDGKMLTNGWAKDSVGTCWIASNGYMPTTTQWIQYDGSWYHITKGYRDESKWMKDSKGWCWLQADGKMLTNGWAKDSIGTCWIASNGYMPTTTQWIQYEGSWYHITKGYRDESKWMKDSKGWCWLQADGKMLTNGWAKDSKGWCWIAANGYMPTTIQWIKYDGGWYYIEKGYRVQNAWRKDSKGWCYLGPEGRMVTEDFVKDSKGMCWIGEDGYMLVETKVLYLDNGTYGIKDGYMVVNGSIEINGTVYVFGNDGKLISMGV